MLSDQLRTAEALDTKVATLFTLATAIIGVGASVGAKQLNSDNVATLVTGGLAAVFYVATASLAMRAFWIRNFNTLTNPRVILRDWTALRPTRFKRLMMEDVADVHEDNARLINTRVRLIKAIMSTLVLESVAVVLALALGTVGI